MAGDEESMAADAYVEEPNDSIIQTIVDVARCRAVKMQ